MNKEDSKKNNNRFLLNFKEIPSEIYMLLLSLAPSCAFYIAEEFSIFILALLISIVIAETFTNSKILNISSIYLVKHEGREMAVFDKDKDKAILCDYYIDNNKMEYKCQENNVIINLDNITMHKLKLDPNN